MTSSLFISFELHSPATNYLAVEEAVAALGQAVRVHTSFWYVESELSPQEAAANLWQAMDERDSVIVVDASHHEAGWKHVSMDVADFIKTHWRPEGRPPGETEPRGMVVSRPRPQDAALLRPRNNAPSKDQARPYDVGP